MLANRLIGNRSFQLNINSQIPLVSSLLLITACGASGASSEQTAFATWDSAGVQVIEYPAAVLEKSAAFELAASPTFRLGAESGPPELQFTRIRGALRLEDGSTAILDRDARAVRLVNENGTFLRSIGREGAGPGEFLSPSLLIHKQEGFIVVWDSDKNQLITFQPNGSVDRSVTFDPIRISSLIQLRHGVVLAVAEESPQMPPGTGGRMQNTTRLVRLHPNGKIDRLNAFPGMEWEIRRQGPGMMILRPWHFPQLLIAATTDGVWISNGTAWELARHRPEDGAVDRIVRFNRPLEPFSQARVRDLHAAELAAASTPEARASILRRHEQEEYPEHIPPIWDLFADATGRIWIAPLELPGATLPMGMGRAASRWLILDRQGLDLVGTITLPPRRRPLYADEHGVLLLTADELDIPYVEWWPFA